MSVSSQNLSQSAFEQAPDEGSNRPIWLVPALHWMMAALIITAFVIGKNMEDLPRDQRLLVMGWHILVGLSVLGLFLPRIIAVIANSRIATAKTGRVQDKANFAAWIMQGILYVLMLAIPLTGLTAMTTIGRNFPVLGLFSLPNFANNHQLHEVMEGIHGTMATVMIILAGLHGVAALWHHFVLKDDVLRRYLPGKG